MIGYPTLSVSAFSFAKSTFRARPSFADGHGRIGRDDAKTTLDASQRYFDVDHGGDEAFITEDGTHGWRAESVAVENGVEYG